MLSDSLEASIMCLLPRARLIAIPPVGDGSPVTTLYQYRQIGAYWAHILVDRIFHAISASDSP